MRQEEREAVREVPLELKQTGTPDCGSPDLQLQQWMMQGLKKEGRDEVRIAC